MSGHTPRAALRGSASYHNLLHMVQGRRQHERLMRVKDETDMALRSYKHVIKTRILTSTLTTEDERGVLMELLNIANDVLDVAASELLAPANIHLVKGASNELKVLRTKSSEFVWKAVVAEKQMADPVSQLITFLSRLNAAIDTEDTVSSTTPQSLSANTSPKNSTREAETPRATQAGVALRAYDLRRDTTSDTGLASQLDAQHRSMSSESHASTGEHAHNDRSHESNSSAPSSTRKTRRKDILGSRRHSRTALHNGGPALRSPRAGGTALLNPSRLSALPATALPGESYSARGSRRGSAHVSPRGGGLVGSTASTRLTQSTGIQGSAPRVAATAGHQFDDYAHGLESSSSDDGSSNESPKGSVDTSRANSIMNAIRPPGYSAYAPRSVQSSVPTSPFVPGSPMVHSTSRDSRNGPLSLDDRAQSGTGNNSPVAQAARPTTLRSIPLTQSVRIGSSGGTTAQLQTKMSGLDLASSPLVSNAIRSASEASSVGPRDSKTSKSISCTEDSDSDVEVELSRAEEDELLCRICEARFYVDDFERHSAACSEIAMALQKLYGRWTAIRKMRSRLVERRNGPRSSGAPRRQQEISAMTKLCDTCDLVESTASVFMIRIYGDEVEVEIPAVDADEATLDAQAKACETLAHDSKWAIDAATRVTARRIGFVFQHFKAAFQRLRETCAREMELINADKVSLVRSSNSEALSLLCELFPASIVSVDEGFAEQLPTINDFSVLKPISAGAFGRVYLAKKKSTRDVFAIKVLRRGDMEQRNLIERVQLERDILAGSSSPWIVRLFWTFISPRKLFFVMEYLPGGDVYSLLCNLGFLDEDVARQYVAETILALEYLHEIGVVHRDLKPDNLIINRDGHLKLIDFGLSKLELIKSEAMGVKMLDEDQTGRRILMAHDLTVATGGKKGTEHDNTAEEEEDSEICGTPDYLAPEILLGTGHSYQADWWALGVILYEFMMGIPPFHDASPERIFENVLNHAIEWPTVPDEMSAESLDLLQRLLDPNPRTRIGAHGAEELKKHPYFAGIDWVNLRNKKAKFIPEYLGEEDTSYFLSRNPMEQLSLDPDELAPMVRSKSHRRRSRLNRRGERQERLSARDRTRSGDIQHPTELYQQLLQTNAGAAAPKSPAAARNTSKKALAGRGVIARNSGQQFDSVIIKAPMRAGRMAGSPGAQARARSELGATRAPALELDGDSPENEALVTNFDEFPFQSLDNMAAKNLEVLDDLLSETDGSTSSGSFGLTSGVASATLMSPRGDPKG
mmetsp:Transcript_14903/g.39935  ORF Transcript_14903/g.39935 Transcript_14903/m.39935 type:complete len:1263 (+) Transcript_14903:162-3950(+)